MIVLPDPSEVSAADLIEAEAHLGRENLYYFTQNILRIGEGSPIVRPREEIEPICKWLQKPRPLDEKSRWKRFLALPRGTAKTSLVQAYAAWRVVKDPNLAVFFTSEEKALSLDSVAHIMEYLASPRVESRYGKFKSERGWQRGKFTVKQRTMPRKEPTMMAGGVDVSSQGRHYDLIIADDLQGLTNNTPEGIAKVKEYLRLLWPILNPGGELIWICTRWDYEDVAGDILQEIKLDPTSWDHMGDRGYFGAHAWLGDHEVFSHAKLNKPLFPSVLPEEELDRLRQTMSHYHFSCQYDNNPLPSTDAYFKSTDFQYVPEYDTENAIFQGLTFYLAIDPNSGTSTVRKGDDVAMVVIGAKGHLSGRTICVVDATGGQWKMQQAFETVALLNDKWRPRRIPIETAGPGKVWFAALRDWMRSKEIYLPLKEIPHAGTVESKSDRIARMEPLYRAHSVFHVQHLKGSKLETQLLRFRPGAATHDDYPDALSMAIEVIREGHLTRREMRKRPTRLTYAPRYSSTGY